MKYYGIKTPEKPSVPSYIWWVADSEHNSWNAFFTYPNKSREFNRHRLPLSEAIKAYESIGYKCVEVDVTEKPNK